MRWNHQLATAEYQSGILRQDLLSLAIFFEPIAYSNYTRDAQIGR